MSEALTFLKLREQNRARAAEWNGDTPWTPADRMTELVGELGEAANVMKKLKRIDDGMPGNFDYEKPMLRAKLIEELGDVQICLDLLAMGLGVNLSKATTDKFNKTSEKNGFEHRL